MILFKFLLIRVLITLLILLALLFMVGLLIVKALFMNPARITLILAVVVRLGILVTPRGEENEEIDETIIQWLSYIANLSSCIVK